jgi:hypothetical protein
MQIHLSKPLALMHWSVHLIDVWICWSIDTDSWKLMIDSTLWVKRGCSGNVLLPVMSLSRYIVREVRKKTQCPWNPIRHSSFWRTVSYIILSPESCDLNKRQDDRWTMFRAVAVNSCRLRDEVLYREKDVTMSRGQVTYSVLLYCN